MKLNLYISKSGYCSRRNAVSLIRDGRVTVNTGKVTEPWREVAVSDDVRVNGKSVKPEKWVYIIFNKPRGVTTTLDDKFAVKKVCDYIPKKFGRIFPVGRLDKDSRGLLIMTNDGDLCYRLTHPKYEVEKEYRVTVLGSVQDSMMGSMVKGIRDQGEELKVRSAQILSRTSNKTVLKIEVCEGKKRHIRRIFESLGFVVADLRRVRMANIRIGRIEEGGYRIVDRHDIYKMAHIPEIKHMS